MSQLKELVRQVVGEEEMNAAGFMFQLKEMVNRQVFDEMDDHVVTQVSNKRSSTPKYICFDGNRELY